MKVEIHVFYVSILYHGAQWQGRAVDVFYVSILYHGAQWQGRAVDVSPTGLDNINIGGVPRVNYFTRKYLWEQHNLTTGSGNSYRKILAIIRLAELYLNYAEALNEAEGPTAEVYNAVNKIRSL